MLGQRPAGPLAGSCWPRRRSPDQFERHDRPGLSRARAGRGADHLTSSSDTTGRASRGLVPAEAPIT
ncbi:MAG: hypothetical protein EBR82_42950 [Caulobacteraceae bacterium]|nr:hypothetical protein [Caulobacteraceae bacterium]